MKNVATFEIIGRISRNDAYDKVTRITTCSNYNYKDAQSGEWKQDPHWNQVVVFNQRPREAAAKLEKGDLVKITGRISPVQLREGRRARLLPGPDRLVGPSGLQAQSEARHAKSARWRRRKPPPPPGRPARVALVSLNWLQQNAGVRFATFLTRCRWEPTRIGRSREGAWGVGTSPATQPVAKHAAGWRPRMSRASA